MFHFNDWNFVKGRSWRTQSFRSSGRVWETTADSSKAQGKLYIRICRLKFIATGYISWWVLFLAKSLGGYPSIIIKCSFSTGKLISRLAVGTQYWLIQWKTTGTDCQISWGTRSVLCGTKYRHVVLSARRKALLQRWVLIKLDQYCVASFKFWLSSYISVWKSHLLAANM